MNLRNAVTVEEGLQRIRRRPVVRGLQTAWAGCTGSEGAGNHVGKS